MSLKITNFSSIFATITIIFFINQSLARTFSNPTQNHHPQNYHNHPKFTFLMQNVLNVTHISSNPKTTKFTTPIPFPKPLGFFPPNGGIPLPQSNPNVPVPGLSTHTFDFSSIGLSFPARATIQELEYGIVTEIDEHLFEGAIYGSLKIGMAQGIFVASSEDGTSHMVAMTAKFGSELNDGLKFFGVYKKDAGENHIAVIGGIGKFDGANGYAMIKSVNGGIRALRGENRIKKVISFNVYLS